MYLWFEENALISCLFQPDDYTGNENILCTRRTVWLLLSR